VSDARVAERYARAFFELGVEAGQLDAFTDQLRRVAEAYSCSAELRQALDNPLVREQQRQAVLDELGARLGLVRTVLNGLKLMAIRRRLRALPETADRLCKLADDHAGVARATVTSAVPLPEGYYEKLAVVLGRQTSRRVVIDSRVDRSLIAGVVTRIGDTVIDGSLKGRLLALERQLLNA
jgi:F-type H+-transporting ATPase subunit delta